MRGGGETGSMNMREGTKDRDGNTYRTMLGDTLGTWGKWVERPDTKGWGGISGLGGLNRKQVAFL